VRDGGEEGAVRLDQQAVERDDRDGIAKLVSVLERDDPGDRDHHPRIDAAPGLGGAAREAVEHRARGHALVLEQVEEVVEGVADVQDQREVGIDREPDREPSTISRNPRVPVEASWGCSPIVASTSTGSPSSSASATAWPEVTRSVPMQTTLVTPAAAARSRISRAGPAEVARSSTSRAVPGSAGPLV
jgi:hypothetical protein